MFKRSSFIIVFISILLTISTPYYANNDFDNPENYLDQHYINIAPNSIKCKRDKEGLALNIQNQTLIFQTEQVLEEKEQLAKIFSDSIIDIEFDIENEELIISSLDLKENEQYQGYLELWEIIKSLDYNNTISRISSIEFKTDGYGNKVGGVRLDNIDSESWIIFLDPIDLIDSDGNKYYEFYISIIHELTHINTLNVDQMQISQDQNNTYFVLEGYLKEDSYLNQYYQEFWNTKFTDNSDSNYNNNDFINRYSSTCVSEDFAETFAYWICVDHSNFQGTNIEYKFQFFEKYPEFNSYREKVLKIIS